MVRSSSDLAAELTKKNIRPSFQRLAILSFLQQNRCHPTVDQIFIALHEQIPTLSKTTVYNTLTAFQQAGLIRILSIDGSEARYDIQTENHGHFKCERCGTIDNFKVDIDRLSIDGLTGFQVNDKNVYFKGICPRCLEIESLNGR